MNTPRFLPVFSLQDRLFLYYDYFNTSFGVCSPERMAQWDKNKETEITMTYIDQETAKKISEEEGKQKTFQYCLETIFISTATPLTRVERDLGKELIEIKKKNAEELKYILAVNHKQFSILDTLDKGKYPEVYACMEKSIEDMRLLYALKMLEQEKHIKQFKIKVKGKILETAEQEQNEFTDFLKNKFEKKSFRFDLDDSNYD